MKQGICLLDYRVNGVVDGDSDSFAGDEPHTQTLQGTGGPGPAFTQAPNDGDLFEGRFRILSLLGKGGMGVVYKARDIVLDRPVALKIILPDFTLSESTVMRMQIEARALGRLDHPNLLRIYDFGVVEEGAPYMVMEYVRGLSLSDVIELEERLAPLRVAKLFKGLCDGLAHAHYNDIIHRDLKPSNCILVLKQDEVLKLLDFGIAKLDFGVSEQAVVVTDSEGNEVNQAENKLTKGMLGTPNYMSPEQFNSKPADARSDLYALGCMLYECLTGEVPLVGPSWIQTAMLRHENDAPLDKIPSQFQPIVKRLLAREPRDRFGTVADLSDKLASLLD